MKFLYLLFIVAISTLLFSCKKEEPLKPEELTYGKAKEVLPIYNNFLSNFKNRGYTFWSFHKYLQADTSNLPQKLIVIRHDVHHHDIVNAYYMYLIENNLIGKETATYFVMLNFPLEKTSKDYSIIKTDYLDLINYLETKNVDVQPHISPWDEYVEQTNPWWKNLSMERIKQIVGKYYSYKITRNYYHIIYKSFDTLNFNQVEKQMPVLLKNYNNIWENETGLTVESYAVHGSETAIQHAFSNVIICNLEIVRKANLFKAETSSPEIYKVLGFLSDNNRPLWMENPDSIANGRYLFLAHPDVWENPQAYRDKYWK